MTDYDRFLQIMTDYDDWQLTTEDWQLTTDDDDDGDDEDDDDDEKWLIMTYNCLIDWLTDLICDGLTDWLIDWLTNLLIDLLTYWQIMTECETDHKPNAFSCLFLYEG